MAGYNIDDYIDVAERLREFYERYPDGVLQSGEPPHVLEVGGKPFIVYHALAYRTPDDEKPAHGWAWEPVPGPTQFTRDSELMNAETAAWGRAIVALGFATKKIASAQEVRNRQQPVAQASPSPATDAGGAAAPPAFTPPPPPASATTAADADGTIAAGDVDVSPCGQKYQGRTVRNLSKGELGWISGRWAPEGKPTYQPKTVDQELAQRAAQAYTDDHDARIDLSVLAADEGIPF